MSNKNIKNKVKCKVRLQINRRVRHLVDELHWKSANYISNNYSNVFIGDLSSKNIVSKCGMLGKLNKRLVNSLAFYKFKARLEYVMSKKINNKLVYVDESYSSKTCSRCGVLNGKLGSSKIFNCQNCNLEVDRDINGSINIMTLGVLYN
jgi:transposase